MCEEMEVGGMKDGRKRACLYAFWVGWMTVYGELLRVLLEECENTLRIHWKCALLRFVVAGWIGRSRVS